VTAELGRQRARRTTEAAADVEHAHARREPRVPRQSQRRALAAGMEVVERREIIDGQRVEALARRGEQREDRLAQAFAAPVRFRRGGQFAGLKTMSPYQPVTVSPVLSVSVSTP
jgi:hypothetical protein